MCTVLLLVSVLSLSTCGALLNFSNFINLTTLSNMEECLLKLIDDYFGDSKSVLIINHEKYHNFFKRIGKPVVLIDSSSRKKIGFKVHSVIIFINNRSIDTLWEITSRTSQTKFVVVANEENLSIVAKCFWNLKILSVLILVEKDKSIEIYTYFPFFNQNCTGLFQPKLVNCWSVDNHRFENSWEDRKVHVDLMKCSLNISFMDFPPFLIRDREVINVNKIAGLEGNIIEILAEKWNFTPNYINRHEQEWGGLDPPSGLVGDVYTGTSDIGFGGLYSFPHRLDYLDIPATHNIQDGSVFVTCEGAANELPEWVTIFSVEFTQTVWLFIFLSFFISVFFFSRFHYLIRNLIGEESGMTVIKTFGLLMGQSQKNTRLWSVRSYILSWVWFGFVITSAYQSFLSGRLTAPPRIPNIDTIKELAESDLTLSGPRGGLILLNVTGDDESSRIIRNVFEKAHPQPRGIAEMLDIIARNRKDAFMHHYPILKYYTSTKKNITSEIHFLKERLFENYPNILLPKGSFLIKEMGKVISGLNSGGFFLKWESDVFVKRKNTGRRKPTKLTIGKFYIILIIFCGGCVVSFLVVLMEIVHFKIKNRQIAEV